MSLLRWAAMAAACVGALVAWASAGPAKAALVRPAWPVVPSPNVGAGDNALKGVTALSPRDAWAVGSFRDTATGHTMTLTEHWDGEAWTVVPSLNLGDGGISALEAVDATSATGPWAVGRFNVEGSGEGTGRTLVEHWNGSEWEVVPSPNAGIEEGGNGTLWDVVTLAPDDVWAVGSYFPDVEFPTLQPLMEHWDGVSWEVVPGPSRSPGPWSEPKAISASGPTDVWAVGVRDARVGDAVTERALILHWDGDAWERVRAPLPAGRLRPFLLEDVVALSPTNAWAVGAVAKRRSHETVAMHWDGESWQIVSSANPSVHFQDLDGVAARSANRVWAVGTYFDADADGMRTLVERWNGERFVRVKSGNRGGSELRDVASAKHIRFAVGESGLEPTRTLILQRHVPPR